MLIGLIADTHGLVRPSVARALNGVELILHAGDVGGRGVLHALREIAPVRVACGNVDDPADPSLEPQLQLEVDGVTVHVSHGHELGVPTPDKLLARYTARVIVYGHTHRQLVLRAGDRVVVNPGAAGPRRFDIEPSLGLMIIAEGHVDVQIVPLV